MCVEENWVKIKHVASEEQRADIMMKALGRVKFVDIKAKINAEEIIFKLEGVIVRSLRESLTLEESCQKSALHQAFENMSLHYIPFYISFFLYFEQRIVNVKL